MGPTVRYFKVTFWDQFTHSEREYIASDIYIDNASIPNRPMMHIIQRFGSRVKFFMSEVDDLKIEICNGQGRVL